MTRRTLADMDVTWMDVVPLTALRLELTPHRPWRHDEPALALRGALGAAVIDVACVAERVHCRACPASPRCLVPGWYDPGLGVAGGARPFWLRAAGGRPFGPDRPVVAHWTFLGALPRPSLVLEAVHRAAAVGLGAERVPHDVAVRWHDGEGWRGGAPEAVPLSALVRVPPPDLPLAVRTASRLRLRRDGRPIRRPSLSDLVESAVLRVRTLERELGHPIPRTWPAPEPLAPPVRCRWETASRRSARQGQDVDLSGAHAAWALGPGEAAPWRDLLAAATWLQVGSGTSAGLGVISVTPGSSAC